MGPFDDDSFFAGEQDALIGDRPEHDNVGYMAGWFSGMEEAEREINGKDDDFDDDDEEDVLDEESEDLFDDEDSADEDW